MLRRKSNEKLSAHCNASKPLDSFVSKPLNGLAAGVTQGLGDPVAALAAGQTHTRGTLEG